NQPHGPPKTLHGRSFGRFVGALFGDNRERTPMVASTGRRIVALLLGAAALCAPALASAQEAQTQSGFALGANLGARDYFLAAGGSGIPNVALPTVGLMAGYKSGRLLLGLGLEFSNTTSNVTMGKGALQISETTSDSSFLIGPDFQAALVRTADGRVELIGDISLHFGHQSHAVPTTPSGGGNTGPTPSNFLLSYALGVGPVFPPPDGVVDTAWDWWPKWSEMSPMSSTRPSAVRTSAAWKSGPIRNDESEVVSETWRAPLPMVTFEVVFENSRPRPSRRRPDL